MNAQTEAQQLANAIVQGGSGQRPPHKVFLAATELRRLDTENVKLKEQRDVLLAALKEAEPMLQAMLDHITREMPEFKRMPALDQVRDAITKAQGE